MEFFRSTAAVEFDLYRVFRIVDQVIPLMWIILYIVKFLATVDVVNVAVGLGNDGVVLWTEAAARHMWPLGFSIF